ncbi:MAG: hypothetical protein ACQEW8_04490 [Actinomycetota bacterium]
MTITTDRARDFKAGAVPPAHELLSRWLSMGVGSAPVPGFLDALRASGYHEAVAEAHYAGAKLLSATPANIPTETTRIYRGARPENRNGASWTPDAYVAQRFAGLHPHGRVYTATAQPPNVIARIATTSYYAETPVSFDELIIDTRGLDVQEHTVTDDEIKLWQPDVDRTCPSLSHHEPTRYPFSTVVKCALPIGHPGACAACAEGEVIRWHRRRPSPLDTVRAWLDGAHSVAHRRVLLRDMRDFSPFLATVSRRGLLSVVTMPEGKADGFLYRGCTPGNEHGSWTFERDVAAAHAKRVQGRVICANSVPDILGVITSSVDPGISEVILGTLPRWVTDD